jgi:hypothetical protein
MSSFVNLMASDVWSDADIKARLHAEIRSQVSEYAETELNRALQGAALGMHTLSDPEMASLMLFKSATDRVALLGTQARADMALLHEVLALEVAQARLAQPVALLLEEGEPPVPVNLDAVALDVQEREAAQAVVDGASAAALALALLRNPAPQPQQVVE